MELFKIVRENCSSSLWSKGVELARRDTVTADHADAAEIRLRVASRDTGISPQVTLWLEDEDWHCDCGGREDPCEHVAAAVIALKRAQEKGGQLPHSRTAGGRVVYRLRSESGFLVFERAIHDGGTERPLEVPLSSLTSGRVGGPPVAATQEDMAVEVALGGERRGKFSPRHWQKIFPYLKNCEQIQLDGKAISVATEPVGLIAQISDEGAHVRIRIAQDPRITFAFRNGVALCGDALHPVVLPELNSQEEKWLKAGETFGARDFGLLTGEYIPALKERMPVLNQSRLLPDSTDAACRIRLHLERRPDGLSVTAELVYGDPIIAKVEGDRLVLSGNVGCRRDPEWEERLQNDLQNIAGLKSGETRFVASNEEALNLVERIRQAGWDHTGDGGRYYQVVGEALPRLVFDEAARSLAINFEVDGKERAVTLPHPRDFFLAKESLVPLMPHGFARIPADWYSRFGDKVMKLLDSCPERTGSLPQALLPSLADLLEDQGSELPSSLQELREKLAHWSMPGKPPLPKGWSAKLRPYQEEGVRWLTSLKNLKGFGALLADDMGLGKTVQTLAVLEAGSLIVAPASLIFNWEAELRKFRPDLSFNRYHGKDRALDEKRDVTITTYALLRSDLATLGNHSWKTVVLDEAQLIKNPESQIAQAAFSLKADFRLGLSGTPIENSLSDLWSQMNFLNPGLLGSRNAFIENIEKPAQNGDASALGTLRRLVAPFMLRRTKAEVAKDLPPRIETEIVFPLSAEEQETYDALLLASRSEIVRALGADTKDMMAALEILLRLRQAACHPALLPNKTFSGPSSKVALLCEKLKVAIAEGHKCLVFSQWTSFLDLIEKAMGTEGLSWARIDGSTVNRGEIVSRFQEDPECRILLLSLKAGGVGLNLTAADHVFLMDPWWNPAVEDQAADRAHRLGQSRPVLIHRYLAKGTVEERIFALQLHKRQLSDFVVKGANISPDELLQIVLD